MSAADCVGPCFTLPALEGLSSCRVSSQNCVFPEIHVTDQTPPDFSFTDASWWQVFIVSAVGWCCAGHMAVSKCLLNQITLNDCLVSAYGQVWYNKPSSGRTLFCTLLTEPINLEFLLLQTRGSDSISQGRWEVQAYGGILHNHPCLGKHCGSFTTDSWHTQRWLRTMQCFLSEGLKSSPVFQISNKIKKVKSPLLSRDHRSNGQWS